MNKCYALYKKDSTWKRINTEDEKIKVVWALPLFKNYIKYNIKIQQNYMEDIYINSLV